MERIRILVNGAQGKVGQEIIKALKDEGDFQLVGETGRKDDLSSCIVETRAEVVIDFTTPVAVFENAKAIISAGAHPVIGTTGLSVRQVRELQKQCKKKQLGGIVAPNFALGAVLMMRYAEDAARFFSAVEIVELHNEQKVDSPSGTALRTAEIIAQGRPKSTQRTIGKTKTYGDRGYECNGVRIHSVRLPGLVAHQEVIFGGKGQILTLRHDSLHRESFVPGVFLACRQVMHLHELVYGLEHIL